MNEEAAATVVERYRHALFDWGRIDCKTFAASFVDARCGTHWLAQLQADLPYDDALSAMRLIKAAGGWEAIVTRYLGPPVPINDVEFGDVVLGRANPPLERTVALGICDEECFMAPGNQGLVWFPMSNALRGWKCRKP
jgi:hypothetical protein